MVYIKNVDKFTIGKLARLAGVNIQTVRYYEWSGVLHPVLKTGGGYRLYREGELKWKISPPKVGRNKGEGIR